MKRNFYVVFFLLVSLVSQAQDTIPSAPSDKALVIFIRPPEMANALDNWVLMADDNEFCRISNNRYVTYISDSGKVVFSSKRGGLGIGKPKDNLELELEAGKTYYVQCDINSNLVSVRILLNEITKSTAKKFILKAKPDKCELKKED